MYVTKEHLLALIKEFPDQVDIAKFTERLADSRQAKRESLAVNLHSSVSPYRDKLYRLLAERAFKFGRFTLSSGKESSYYFDGKQVTLYPEGAYLLAKIILGKITNSNIQAIGGPTMGADPIIGSLAVVAYLDKFPLKLFMVRKSTKEHGLKKLIEGPRLLSGERVAIVEDVMTTGASIIWAINAVQEVGCRVVKVIPLVDRLEGGTEKIHSLGIDVDPVFTVQEFNQKKQNG